MARPPSARALARRLLGRPVAPAVPPERVARLEVQLAELADRVAGVEAALERLHATLVGADPELTRQIVESIRADVTRLAADVNAQLAGAAPRAG